MGVCLAWLAVEFAEAGLAAETGTDLRASGDDCDGAGFAGAGFVAGVSTFFVCVDFCITVAVLGAAGDD